VHFLLLPQSDESIAMIAHDGQVGSSGNNGIAFQSFILLCLVIFGDYNIIFLQCAILHHLQFIVHPLFSFFYDKNDLFYFVFICSSVRRHYGPNTENS
jgi:hypothetical protein